MLINSDFVYRAIDKVSLYKSPTYILKMPLLVIKLACIVSYKLLIHEYNYQSFFTSTFLLPILIYLVQNIPKWYEIYSCETMKKLDLYYFQLDELKQTYIKLSKQMNNAALGNSA